MSSPCYTVPAPAAHHMSFAADSLARMKVRHIRSNGNDLPHKFVPNDHRNRNCGLSPGVPVIDMQVRAADARMSDPDQHVIDADRGLRNLLQAQTRRPFGLNECFHRLPAALVFDERSISTQSPLSIAVRGNASLGCLNLDCRAR